MSSSAGVPAKTIANPGKEQAKPKKEEEDTAGLDIKEHLKKQDAKEAPQLRVIFHDDYRKTRIISINVPNDQLKKEVKDFLTQYHDNPFKALKPKPVDEGTDQDKIFFEFQTTDYYRDMALFLEKRYTLLYVDQSYRNFVHPPETLASTWGTVPFALKEEQMKTGIQSSELDLSQNTVLKQCVTIANGRALLYGRLLHGKKLIALQLLHKFQFESQSPIVIVTRHGRVAQWYETLYKYGTKGGVLNLFSKAAAKDEKKTFDYVIVTEQLIDRVGRLIEQGASFKYYVFDDVLYNKVVAKKIFTTVKHVERVAVISRGYQELEDNVKRMVFGMILRPDFGNSSHCCKSYPCLENSHAFSVQPATIFNPDKKYKVDDVLKIVDVHQDFAKEVADIEGVLERKDKAEVEAAYKKYFSDKKDALKKNLEQHYLKSAGEQATLVTVKKYDEEVKADKELEKENLHKLKDPSLVLAQLTNTQEFTIRQMGQYVENHVHESMYKALRFHLIHSLEDAKMQNVFEDLCTHPELSKRKKIVVFGYNTGAMANLRKNVEKSHPDWRLVEGGSKMKTKDVRAYFQDEVKTIMTCSVTCSKANFVGLRFDTAIFSDLSYNLESIRDVVALSKLSYVDTSKMLVYYTTNNKSELAVWSKFEAAFKFGFRVDTSTDLQPAEHRRTIERCCLLQDIKPTAKQTNDRKKEVDGKTEKEILESIKTAGKKTKIVEETTGRKPQGAKMTGATSSGKQGTQINPEELIKKGHSEISVPPRKKATSSLMPENLVAQEQMIFNFANLLGETSENIFPKEGTAVQDDFIPEELADLGKRLLKESGLAQMEGGLGTKQSKDN